MKILKIVLRNKIKKTSTDNSIESGTDGATVPGYLRQMLSAINFLQKNRAIPLKPAEEIYTLEIAYHNDQYVFIDGDELRPVSDTITNVLQANEFAINLETVVDEKTLEIFDKTKDEGNKETHLNVSNAIMPSVLPSSAQVVDVVAITQSEEELIEELRGGALGFLDENTSTERKRPVSNVPAYLYEQMHQRMSDDPSRQYYQPVKIYSGKDQKNDTASNFSGNNPIDLSRNEGNILHDLGFNNLY